MPTIAPAASVAAPTRVPPPYGLFSAVPFVEGPGRWEAAGVEWEGVACDPLPPAIVTDCDPAQVVGLPKQVSGHYRMGSATHVFTLYGTFDCSALGYTPADAEVRARDHLTSREESAVEARVWEELVTDPDYNDLGAQPDAAGAVAAVECDLRSRYGALGVLHVSCLALAPLIKDGLVSVSGGRLVSCYGTPAVVAGADGPGDLRVGITPAMLGWRSEIFSPGGLFETAQNNLKALAERTYLFGWDACGTASATFAAAVV